MYVHITSLEIGDEIISNVFNHYGLHVLSAQTKLSEEDISMLFRHSIEYVEIKRRNHELSETETDPIVTKIITKIQPRFETAVHGIKDLFEQVLSEGKIDERQVESSFEPLIENFEKEKDVVSLLLTLSNKDDYTYQHSVQVGMIAYYLAQWIGNTEEEALLAGKAGYLHDIGKSRIESEILQKPGKLTQKEFDMIKQHTTFGFEIITNSGMDKNIALAALQHHERMNGKGYPNGITGDAIQPISKIIAVADVYSAMISSRVYQKKKDLLFVLKELYRLSFEELDPIITQTFIRHMVPNFIGKKIALKSGETGHIVLLNPTDFFRPLIQVEEQFIDLSQENQYEIDMIYL